ncbi:MAG: carbamoyltransferase HypF, partial [Candidatus Aminicenantes bacterium RBG_13_63_10]
TVEPAAERGYRSFAVRKSGKGRSFVFISPDIAVCEPCLEETMTPGERRHLYPFTNCTDCGPRYTIVTSLPYDRAQTTMAGFRMCPDCGREYGDPLDRRYHAQPIACPRCGPRVTLIDARSGKTVAGGIDRAAALIKRGKILAVKGLGGFHLMCDPRNSKAVARLRRLKQRNRKPLALMADSIETAARIACVSKEERELLLSPARPIVLLRKKGELPLIAPGLGEVGLMLAYTPLHHILLRGLKLVVATSSNKKDSPIMKEREPGLPALCDFILDHDRPIHMRADDSVAKVVEDGPLLVRRARGFVPYPQKVPEELRAPEHVLALGAELKDTVSVYKNGYVVTSQFLGDLDEYENRRYLKEAVGHLVRLFDVRPRLVVSDLHPDFHTTRLAAGMGLPHLRVQHHFAHMLAPLLEHGHPPSEKVLGVIFDGYGYGADGGAWGGEFLVADYASFERFGRLKEVPLPGGDLAAREPWRMAAAYLREAFGGKFLLTGVLKGIGERRVRGLSEMMDRRLNSPPTSSCGRLFDAASFILGFAPREMEYEAEAAMRLEAEAAKARTAAAYPFDIGRDSGMLQVSFEPAVRALVADRRSGAAVRSLAARKFHNTIAQAIRAMARRAKKEHSVRAVVLVGGVFLNRILLDETVRLLEGAGFRVLRPRLYSPCDESISLGQIAHGLAWLRNKKRKTRG